MISGSVFGSLFGGDDDGGLGVCTCGNFKKFDQCCGPILSGRREAATAEELMRARYSAFARGDHPYLMRTWHPTSRPSSVRQLPPPDVVRWMGMDLLRTEDGGPNDDTGIVEFNTRYMAGFQMSGMHEVARYVRENGLWFYLGDVEDEDAGGEGEGEGAGSAE